MYRLGHIYYYVLDVKRHYHKYNILLWPTHSHNSDYQKIHPEIIIVDLERR